MDLLGLLLMLSGLWLELRCFVQDGGAWSAAGGLFLLGLGFMLLDWGRAGRRRRRR
jgi:hypothetical protein